MGELFNGQLQSIALVNEDGSTIQDKLNGAAVANEERVLNHLTGRDLDYGIKDYDLGYHDADDTIHW